MQDLSATTLTLVREFDTAACTTFIRGKDGRLYRTRDVMAAEGRARAGDAAARAALIVVDFAVADDGTPLASDAAAAAMLANDDAWCRGEFDHLRGLGELGPSKAPPHWMRAGRARRERAAEARRDRPSNSSMREVDPDAVAQLPTSGTDLPPRGAFFACSIPLPTSSRS